MSEYRDASAALREAVQALEQELAAAKTRDAELGETLAELRQECRELELEIARARLEAKQRRLDRALNAVLLAPMVGAAVLVSSGVFLLVVWFLFHDNPPLGLIVGPAYVLGVLAAVWAGRKVWRGEWTAS